jgi:hypothetical protein
MQPEIIDLEQGSDAWLKEREGKYTGSNSLKLLKYGAIEYSTTKDTGFGGNWHTKRGHVLEDEALEIYEKIVDADVLRVGLVHNPKYPKCAYSPDGVLGDVLIEVKCFNETKHYELLRRIPAEILAQIHFGMMICGLDKAVLIAYHPKLPAKDAFRVIEIKKNYKILGNFKRKLRVK